MKAFPGLRLAAALFAAVSAGAAASLAWAAPAPAVVVTLKPLHALVAGVMQGVGEPVLLFDGAPGPAPLDARQKAALDSARLLFWLDKDQAPRVAGHVANREEGFSAVALMHVSGVRLMDARHGHRRVAAASPRPRAAAPAPKKAAPTLKDGNVIFRKRGEPAPKAAPRTRPPAPKKWSSKAVPPAKIATPDPHIWLDPRNAIAIVRGAAAALAKADPANAARYRRNAAVLVVRIEALNDGMTATTRTLRKTRYAVTNNALQYFEDHYVMMPAFEFRLTVERPPKAAVAAAHRQIAAAGVGCVFAPTNLAPASARALVAETKARLVPLDLYGRLAKPGPDAYFALIRGIGDKIAACLR